MLKHHAEQIQTGIRILDVLICFFAFAAAFLFREQLAPLLPGALGNVGNLSSRDSLPWLLVASLALHFPLYSFLGYYESIRQKTPQALTLMVFKAFALEFFILGALVFLFQAKDTSRYLFILFLVLNHATVLASRLGAWILLSSARLSGYNFRQVLIVGTGHNSRNVISGLRRNLRWGYVLCGTLAEQGSTASASVDGVPVLGTEDQLEEIVRGRPVDEIVFALDQIDSLHLQRQIQTCESLGIPARLSLSSFNLPNSKVRFGNVDNLPFLSFYRASRNPLETFAKRFIDVITAVVGLAITAVLFPWIAYKIKKESPGPVIFRQKRIGENGRTFTCYKFRTMGLDAEQRKSELAVQNTMSGPMFKLEQDPRVFPFGQFLRKSSLDELPQFMNILKGEMSLVGTRPPTPEEVSQYELQYRRRLSIRPGLTGLWQVSGRSSLKNFEDVLALDLHYIDNWSIWLDLKIVMKTAWVVARRGGAC